MVAVNQSWHELAATAMGATRQARDASYFGRGRNRLNQVMRAAVNAANSGYNQSRNLEDWQHNSTSRSETIYRGLTYHELARRIHQAAYNYHKRNQMAVDDEGLYSQHAEASSLHHRAALAHDKAARVAASQIPINLELHRAFKQSIKENPNDPAHRLIFADFLQEHGLERPALRLRLDPTGHIIRLSSLRKRLSNYPRALGPGIHGQDIQDAERSILGLRSAVRASIRANKLRSKSAHLGAAYTHRNEAQQLINIRNQRVRIGIPERVYNLFNSAIQSHYDADRYHRQQAERLQ